MRFNLEAKLNADDKKANEGVDFFVTSEISLKLKSAGKRNKELTFRMEQFYRKHKIDASKEMPKKYLDEWMRIFAECIVVSWNGVKNLDTGKVIKCTTDNVVLLFNQVDNLFNMCIEFAQDVSNYPHEEPTQDEVEENAKH